VSVVPAKLPLTQSQQNKGADCGFQKTAEGAPPYPYHRDHSGEVEGFMFLSVHTTDKLKWSTHTAIVPLQPQEAEEIWLGT
jgi:hypothetical protein